MNNIINNTIIDQAAKVLLQAAPSGSRVILFGSQARQQARVDSDLDFLVIEPTVSNSTEEMVRLRDTLRPLRIPIDLLVMSADQFDYWRETANTLAYRASKEG